MEAHPSICERDDYDDYVVSTVFELRDLIKLRLKEAERIPPIKGVVSKKVFLKHAYEEALSHAKRLRLENPNLPEIPTPGLDNETNLNDLISWCKSILQQHQQETIIKGVIVIDASQFSSGKTWRLLKVIIDDERRKGIKCDNPRTLRSLKERLKKAGYIKLAESLKYKGGLAWTTIPFGKILISPKNNSATNSADRQISL